MVVYYSTSEEAAASILKDGFRDSPLLTGGVELHGIWVSSKPRHKAGTSVTIRITLPLSKDQLAQSEGILFEEANVPAHPFDFERWYVPSKILNTGTIEHSGKDG